MLTNQQYQANERYFLRMMQLTKRYIWVDKGHTYLMTSKTMKSLTPEGYDDLAKAVRQPFLKMFVLTPD